MGASSVKFISWSYFRFSGSFSNFFLLNKYINGQIYSSRSSGFVLSGSFPISPLSYIVVFFVFISFVLLVLNCMSSCFIVQFPGHLVNLMVPFFQLTSRLYLTSQSCPKNMLVPSRSITATSKISLCLLISISRSATLVTSPFFVLSVLKTSKAKFIGLVGIFLSLINCSSISVCVQLEFTSVFTFNLLLFFVLMFACTFNSFFPLLVQQFGIIYLLFWEFTWSISCTMPTRDCHQNPPPFYHLYCLILPGLFVSSLSVFLYSLWLCVLSCYIWNMFVFLVPSFPINILLSCVCTCYNWSTLASCP